MWDKNYTLYRIKSIIDTAKEMISEYDTGQKKLSKMKYRERLNRKRKEQRIHNPWDIIKWPNIHVIGDSEKANRKNKLKNNGPQISRYKPTESRISTPSRIFKKAMQRHVINIFLRTTNKETVYFKSRKITTGPSHIKEQSWGQQKTFCQE